MNNRNNKRRLFIASTLIGAMTLATTAFAGPGGHCGKHGKFGGERGAAYMQKKMERMADKLGLSAEQSAQVKQVMQTHRSAMQANRTKMKALKETMHNLDTNTANYDAQLESLANNKAELVRQMTIAKGKKRQQMASILTADQQAKMKQMRAERKSRHGKRHGGKAE